MTALLDTTPSPSGSLPLPPQWSLAELQQHLGGVPLERICGDPAPGQATAADLMRLGGDLKGYELIDGTLVRKPMGYYESTLALLIARLILNYLDEHPLGVVAGEEGMLEVRPGQIRKPDVSFTAWARFPGGQLPRTAAPALAPDLAVEILSPSNTEAEMNRKRRDFFAGGTRTFWMIDPATRTARIYSSPDDFVAVAADGALAAEDVLPGFTLSLADLFRRAGERPGS